jgi:hypothetical protein
MSEMTAIEVFREKFNLISMLNAAISNVDKDFPNAIESISVYGNRFALTLKGADELKRQFTFKLLSDLNIKKFKRDLSTPSKLEYNFPLSSKERWSSKNAEFEFNIDDYPCNFHTECEKTCYAVYEDGRRIPIVKKDKIETSSYEADVNALQNELEVPSV